MLIVTWLSDVEGEGNLMAFDLFSWLFCRKNIYWTSVCYDDVQLSLKLPKPAQRLFLGILQTLKSW